MRLPWTLQFLSNWRVFQDVCYKVWSSYLSIEQRTTNFETSKLSSFHSMSVHSKSFSLECHIGIWHQRIWPKSYQQLLHRYCQFSGLWPNQLALTSQQKCTEWANFRYLEHKFYLLRQKQHFWDYQTFFAQWQTAFRRLSSLSLKLHIPLHTHNSLKDLLLLSWKCCGKCA